MAETPEKQGTKARLSRQELDKLEAEMIMRPFEKREFAGDPKQPRRLWVRTRNKKG
jgi:hypothetical protein